MNIIGFVISLIAFIYLSLLSYEVWFAPKKFTKRKDEYTNSIKSILGVSYWTNGYVNWTLVKIVSIIGLIVSLLGIIVSIRGPFTH